MTSVAPQQVLLMACLAAGACASQTIDINGRVVDGNGSGLAGASVVLLGKQLWVTTAADGSFHIDEFSPVVVEAVAGRAAAPRLLNGRLHFGVSGTAADVRVDVFDISGRTMGRLAADRFVAGNYSVPVAASGLASRLCVVRLQVGQETWVFRSAPGLGAGLGAWQRTGGQPQRAAAKSAAGAVDTLAVSLPRYTTAKVALTSYVASDVLLQLARGIRISFTIDRGSRTVVTRACSLFVVDSAQVLARVRFTQQADSLAPLFDSVDADNAVRSCSLGAAVNSFPWLLKAGGGEKRVWAEVAWRDSAAGLDTMYAWAAIAPWQIGVKPRNRQAVFYTPAPPDTPWQTIPDSVELVWRHSESADGTPITDQYVLGRQWLEYSVDVGGDSSMVDSFTCWILTPADTASCWLETRPRMEVLNRAAGSQDTNRVYVYSLDPQTTEGQADLAYLRRMADTAGYPSVTYLDSLAGTAQQNWARVVSLDPLGIAWSKMFALVLHFRGKYFGDDRYYLSYRPPVVRNRVYPSLLATVNRSMSFDFWPPGMSGEALLNNGDTVGMALSLTAAYVGFPDASIGADEQIVVARKPTGLAWDYRTWQSSAQVPLTLEQFVALPHEVFPLSAISTYGWPSGEYLVGVVTTDIFGNRGLAPLPFDAVRHTTNPFLVTVLSGS